MSVLRVLCWRGCPVVGAGYDESKILTDVIAQRTARLDLEIQASDGGAWRKIGQPVRSGQLDLGTGFAAGASKLNDDTYVRQNDKHYDAMLWPHVRGPNCKAASALLIGGAARGLGASHLQLSRGMPSLCLPPVLPEAVPMPFVICSL